MEKIKENSLNKFMNYKKNIFKKLKSLSFVFLLWEYNAVGRQLHCDLIDM